MILREIKNMYFPALQQIEYLESNGMQYINGRRAPGLQYIDTGVLMDSANAFIGTTVEFEVLELATDINNTALIAGALTSVYEGYNCLVYQGDIYPGNCFSFSQTEQALNMKTTATIYKNVDYIPNQNFILFGRSIGSPDTIEYFGIKRIYSCKIIKNGDTIRDFIPVRVGTKGYMLDKVSGELYGNSGTGDFVLGPDVGYINSSKNLQQIYQNRLIEGADYIKGNYFQSSSSNYYQNITYAPSGINNFVMDLQAPTISTACFRIAPKKWFGAMYSNNTTFGGIYSGTNSGGALWFQFTNKTMRFSHTKGIPTVNVKIINGAISETNSTISSGTDYQFNDYNKTVNDSLGFECKNCYFRPVELNGIPAYCIKTLHKIPAQFSFYGKSIPENTFGILIERKIIPFLTNTLLMH